NYCVTRRELLAIIHFLRYLRHYLLGVRFRIRTDHAALLWLRRIPEPVGQQARWLELMEEYSFFVEHRPDKSHANADAMSRIPSRVVNGDESDAVKSGIIAVKSESDGVNATLRDKSDSDSDIGEEIAVRQVVAVARGVVNDKSAEIDETVTSRETMAVTPRVVENVAENVVVTRHDEIGSLISRIHNAQRLDVDINVVLNRLIG